MAIATFPTKDKSQILVGVSVCCGSNDPVCSTPRSGGQRDSPRPSDHDPSLWTVEEVMQYIRDVDPVLAPHADLFRKHVRTRRPVL